MDTLSSLNSLHVISLSSFNYFSKNCCKTHLNVNSSVNSSISNLNPALINTRNQQLKVRIKAVSDVSESITDPIQAQVTWEIVVGALAGVIPFVVAGIEFSKRIAAQRRCEVCGGSGLVLRDKKYYFRCPGCGGFLPWQSWRRFFSG